MTERPRHSSTEDIDDLTPYEEAFSDLDAYFGELDAATGFKAQSYDGCGNAVFDSEAVHALHMSKRTTEHRFAVQRRTRIRRVLMQLPLAHHHVLETCFSPRRWEWTDRRSREARKKQGERSESEKRAREEFALNRSKGKGGMHICLLALSLDTLAARTAFLDHAAIRALRSMRATNPVDVDPASLEPTKTNLMHFLETEAGLGNEKILTVVRREATKRLVRSIGVYMIAWHGPDWRTVAEDRSEQQAAAVARDRARKRLTLIQGAIHG